MNIFPPNQTAKKVASIIIRELEAGKKVLWLQSGGSSIEQAVAAANIIKAYDHSNLVVSQTDERYGPVGHKDSNWAQMIEQGFDLPQAKLVPVLNGKSRAETCKEFGDVITREMGEADFVFALFGVGADGHIAGILPHTVAVDSTEPTADYAEEKFERITITPPIVAQIDEAVVYAVGESKWPALSKLDQELPIGDHPAQLLNQISIVSIFSDLDQS